MDKIILIAGPTGVGKTAASVSVAKKIGGEIISADSMQIYRKMDIGTAKIMPDEMKEIPHHLIDIVEPYDEFSVKDFDDMSKTAIKEISGRSNIPVIAGGTGLYINAIVYDMDYNKVTTDSEFRNELWKYYEEKGTEELYNILLKHDPETKIEKQNIKRVIRAIEIIKNNGEFRQFSNMKKNSMYDIRMYVLYRERSKLYEIINSRVDHMVKSGLVDEVRSLLNDGLDKSCQSMKAIGYRQIISYLEGEYDLDTAIELIKRDSRRYAKRQLTWFRRYEDAVWINVDSMNTEQISDFIIKEAMIDK